MSFAMSERTPKNEEHVGRVRQLIKEYELDTVIVGGCDINGIFRGQRLPAWRFEREPDAPVYFCDHVVTMDVEIEPIPREPDFEGWWPDWSGGRGDMVAHPDLSTFRIVPWLRSTGLVLCDYTFRDGTPLEHMPRQILQRVLDRFDGLGFAAKVAPELEFYLFRRGADGHIMRPLTPLSHELAYYSVSRASLDEHVIRPMRDGLDGLGVIIDAWSPESSPGQYELNLRATDPLEAADRGFLLKHSVREIAAMHDLAASFMALPMADYGGNGFHVHVSLWSEDDNAMWDEEKEDNLSDVARHFIGGQLATVEDFSVMFAPTVNSYKRFLPGRAAGNEIAWGVENKSTAIRAVNGDSGGCRVEHRTAGADANPYLVVAALLAAGIYGIENQIAAPEAFQGNAYEREDISSVPRTLADAIPKFENSSVTREYLGAEFVDYYAATRRWEHTQFSQAVTDWEIDRYLT